MNHVSFQNLKKKFEHAEQEDQILRRRLAELIDISQLKEFSRSKRAVVLVAVSKAYAQELFLRKEALQSALACEVIVR